MTLWAFGAFKGFLCILYENCPKLIKKNTNVCSKNCLNNMHIIRTICVLTSYATYYKFSDNVYCCLFNKLNCVYFQQSRV